MITRAAGRTEAIRTGIGQDPFHPDIDSSHPASYRALHHFSLLSGQDKLRAFLLTTLLLPREIMTTTLFDPFDLSGLQLANRIVMAPLTRNRSPGAIPQPIAVTYYAQRASAGLIITEGTAISPQGQGYADVPGLYTEEALEGWRAVTQAVHAKGGKIVVQLWHVGRVSHDSLQPNGQPPVAPSAIQAQSKTYLINASGQGSFVPTSLPRALGISELPGIIDDYRRAARAAIEVGFDGIEIHAANGYLIDHSCVRIPITATMIMAAVSRTVSDSCLT